MLPTTYYARFSSSCLSCKHPTPPPPPTSLGLWLPDIPFSLCPGAGYCHLTKYISATSKTWNVQTIIFLRACGRGNCLKDSRCSGYFGLICPRKCCVVTKITYMYICFREEFSHFFSLSLFHTSSLGDNYVNSGEKMKFFYVMCTFMYMYRCAGWDHDPSSGLSLSGGVIHHTCWLIHSLWDVLLPPLLLCLFNGALLDLLRCTQQP